MQNEDTGAAQTIILLQKMSWAAYVAPCAMSRVKSLPRHQEGLTEVWVQQEKLKGTQQNIWQQGAAKALLISAHQQVTLSLFLTALSSFRYEASSCSIKSGLYFPFSRKTSSALFFPQTCYPAVFLVTWHSLISTVTAFSITTTLEIWTWGTEYAERYQPARSFLLFQ